MNPFERMQEAIVMDESAPVSQAVGKLGRSDSCIIVTKGGKYIGILDDISAVEKTSDPTTTKIGHAMKRAPLIENGASLLEICKAFFNGAYKALPVEQDENVVGVLGRMDVLASLVRTGVVVGNVREHMSTPAVAVEETANLAQARAKMREANVRRLVIIKGGKIAGLISTYDLRKASDVPKERAPFVKEKHSIEEPKLGSLMVDAEEVATISPDATMADAARKMVENGVASLVVASDGKPEGLLSVRDVFESIMAQERAPVYISGLDYSDRMMVDEINAEVEKELEKMRKSMELEYLALHFKKYGNKHSVHARLKTVKFGLISASNHGFDLQGTVHGVMDGLKKIVLHKKKPDPSKGKRTSAFRGMDEA